MITQADQYEVQSNVTGEKIAMTIKPEDMAHVMGLLTAPYSNPRRAIVREYSTNAWDAHVESGVARPIEVGLPTLLSPFLKVRDFGCGLGAEDIRVVYCHYGASTKRGTNSQNGTLGIGCKSALAYCSQFTVVSVKDGQKIVVNVGRDEDGRGAMTVVSESPSTDEAGTEVVIPIGRNDMDAVTREAEDFFSVWKPGTVLLNGKQPRHFLATSPLRLTDDLYVVGRGESRVVMGNVAYPAPALDDLVPNASVLAFVPIGSVSFPPSREALMDTRTTRATIEKIKADFKTALNGAIQREVSAAPTPQEAVRIVIKWSRTIPGSSVQAASYSYQGENLPASYWSPGYDTSRASYEQAAGVRAMVVSSATGYQRKGYSTTTYSIPVFDWPSTVWVTDFKPGTYTAQHKNKMVKWCAEQGITVGRGDSDVNQFVMCPAGGPTSKFIDPSRVVSWEDIRSIKLDVAHPAWKPMRIPGSYDFYTEAGMQEGKPGDQIDQKSPIFWVNCNKWAGRQYMDGLKGIHSKFTLVCLPANRIDKFKRDVPKAVNVHDEFKGAFKKWLTGLTSDQRGALAVYDSGNLAVFQMLDKSKVDDPKVKEAIRLSKIDTTALVDARRMFARYAAVDTGGSWKDPMRKYPLFDRYAFRTDPGHIYQYMNLMYAAK